MTVTSDWTLLTPATSPPGRYSFAFAVDTNRNKAVLFGGLTTILFSSALNDTWEWDGTTWAHVVTAHSPSVRFSEHTMAFDPATGKMLLFGGLDTAAANLNDTWVYDGSDWTQLSPAHHPVLSNNSNALVCTDVANGNVVLFTGRGGTAPSTVETWTWDGTDWTQQSPATSPPYANAEIAFDPSTNLVTLGPGANGSHPSNDFWTWNGSNWTQHVPATTPDATLSGLAYSTEAAHLILYAGLDGGAGGFVRKTYLWDGSDVTLEAPLASPTPNAGFEMVTDPLTSKPLLFGGVDRDGGFFVQAGTWLFSFSSTPPGGDDPYLSAIFSTVV